MRRSKAMAWLSSIVVVLAGLLVTAPAAQAAYTGTPRVQITVRQPQNDFRPASGCDAGIYWINIPTSAPSKPGGGIDYTPFSWYASITVTDSAGNTTGTPYTFSSSDSPDFMSEQAFPICADSAAGTWTLTLSYSECEGTYAGCAPSDPIVASYTASETFLVVDPPPLVTSVDVAGVDYTARKAIVTSEVNADPVPASPRRSAATLALPAGTRVIVQKRAKNGHWKNLRTVATDASGRVSTKIQRTHQKQRVRFYLPAGKGFKSSVSRAVKIKARKH